MALAAVAPPVDDVGRVVRDAVVPVMEPDAGAFGVHVRRCHLAVGAAEAVDFVEGVGGGGPVWLKHVGNGGGGGGGREEEREEKEEEEGEGSHGPWAEALRVGIREQERDVDVWRVFSVGRLDDWKSNYLKSLDFEEKNDVGGRTTHPSNLCSFPKGRQ